VHIYLNLIYDCNHRLYIWHELLTVLEHRKGFPIDRFHLSLPYQCNRLGNTNKQCSQILPVNKSQNPPNSDPCVPLHLDIACCAYFCWLCVYLLPLSHPCNASKIIHINLLISEALLITGGLINECLLYSRKRRVLP
jgi:hypothetical protein